MKQSISTLILLLVLISNLFAVNSKSKRAITVDTTSVVQVTNPVLQKHTKTTWKERFLMKRLQKKIAKQKTSENSGQKQTRSSGYVLIAAVISGLVIAMAGAAVIGFLIMMLGSFISALIAFSSLIKQKQAGNKDKKLKGNTNLLMGTAFVIALLAAGGLIAALVTDAIKEFFWWCC